MPDFKQSFPEHKPFKCGHYWHFKRSGSYLAVYDFVGAMTAGGERPFFASIKKVATYFDFNYESTRRVFANLRKMGWLELRPDGKMNYVSHEKWAAKLPGKCKERPLLDWQVDTDPLVGKLFALSSGKLRVFEKQVTAIRKFGASDERILDLFGQALVHAQRKKEKGFYDGTSVKSCFWRVFNFLKEKQQEGALKEKQQTDPKADRIRDPEVVAAIKVLANKGELGEELK
jgi:hypothetical protein